MGAHVFAPDYLNKPPGEPEISWAGG